MLGFRRWYNMRIENFESMGAQLPNAVRIHTPRRILIYIPVSGKDGNGPLCSS